MARTDILTGGERFEAEKLCTQLLASGDVVVWAACVDGSELLYLNPAAEKAFGASLADLRGNPDPWFAAVHPDDRGRFAECFQAPTEQPPVRREYRLDHSEW